VFELTHNKSLALRSNLASKLKFNVTGILIICLLLFYVKKKQLKKIIITIEERNYWGISGVVNVFESEWRLITLSVNKDDSYIVCFLFFSFLFFSFFLNIHITGKTFRII